MCSRLRGARHCGQTPKRIPRWIPRTYASYREGSAAHNRWARSSRRTTAARRGRGRKALPEASAAAELRAEAGTPGELRTSTFLSHPVTNGTPGTPKGSTVPSQGVTAVSEPTSQESAVPREASSISSAFLFWPSKAKSKACSFVRIRSSDTQRETYQLHSARSFLKGRSSIWNAKKKKKN